MEEKRITISPRTEKGKGAVRRLRSQNRIPAVVYGPAIEPMPVTVSYTDLEDYWNTTFQLNTYRL